MISTQQVQDLLSNGGDVVGHNNTKIGSIGHVILNDRTKEPEWVTAKTGMLGGGKSFIPLRDASVSGNSIHVAFDKGTVKDAPRVDDSKSHLSQDEEAELYRYYGMSDPKPQSDSEAAVCLGGLTGDPFHRKVDKTGLGS